MDEKDFNTLLATWKKRVRDTIYDDQYIDGIRDCLYDLKSLLSDLNTSKETHNSN